MQSTNMAAQQITEEAVYLYIGNPLPKDIEQISYWLLNEPFSSSFQRIQHLLILDLFLACNLRGISSSQHLLLLLFFFIFVGWCLTLRRNIRYDHMKATKGLALVDIVKEVTM